MYLTTMLIAESTALTAVDKIIEIFAPFGPIGILAAILFIISSALMVFFYKNHQALQEQNHKERAELVAYIDKHAAERAADREAQAREREIHNASMMALTKTVEKTSDALDKLVDKLSTNNGLTQRVLDIVDRLDRPN